MENLQIEAGYVLKLVGICCGGVAYYLSLRNSVGILNERLKMNKRNIECIQGKQTNHETRLSTLEGEHKMRCGKK